MKQLIKSLFSSSVDTKLEEVIKNGAFLVDVRSPGEFASGSVEGAVNIPLDTIPDQLQAFKNKDAIVLFCRSGQRSGMAKNILEQNGLKNIHNGGTWQNVNQMLHE